ncbi:methyltransferase domain-containing protein [Kosakonia sp. ML.JS2a]|uniref:methyltransferase domain-containing protein n=1 Tax=Kosakonia sp. ML.JS2a TaxID=2980557 RepID=UPI003986CFB8
MLTITLGYHLTYPNHLPLLIIGCGNGNSTKSLLSICSKVVSIEVNDTLIKMAEENITSADYKAA